MNRKSESIKILVSPEEKKLIFEKAQEYNFVSMSDFVRVMLIKGKLEIK